MKESKEITGYGAHALRSWTEIRQSGGPAPDPKEIGEYLDKPKREKLTRKELKQRIQAYFNSLIELVEDPDTGQRNYAWRSCPTKAGLAMAIGISSFTLFRYLRGENCDRKPYSRKEWGNRAIVSPDDFDLLDQAITVIESFFEGNLGRNINNSGSIFWLKNLTDRTDRTNVLWQDKQDINLSANREDDLPHMTREEIMLRHRALNGSEEPPRELDLGD